MVASLYSSGDVMCIVVVASLYSGGDVMYSGGDVSTITLILYYDVTHSSTMPL